MKKTRVGVVRGGPGAEYEESIKTGSAIIAALDRDKYDVIDVFVDREGRWHIDGMPIMQKELADRLDVAVVALHGEYGSGGWVQGVLEQVGVPYTGSGVVSS